MSELKDGQLVIYEVPIDHERYAGEVDGEPWRLGKKRTVVRLKNLDRRYRQRYHRSVVPYTDVENVTVIRGQK